MIYDRIENSGRYLDLHPGFAAAFDFLKKSDLFKLPHQRYEIDNDWIYAIITHGKGRGQQNSKLEAHRKYIDIQFTISGLDVIGWKPTQECITRETEFDPLKDIEFFLDEPDTWIQVPRNKFVILFPDDAHAPLASDEDIHKVVIKIAVDYTGQ